MKIICILLILIIYIAHDRFAKKFIQRLDLFEEELISLSGRYITHSDETKILPEISDLAAASNFNPIIRRKRSKTIWILEHFEEYVKTKNKEFIEREIKEHFSELKEFDHSQQTAIITDQDETLLIAGAGSGKTRTIVGKVKYLRLCRSVAPDEILLLSFSNDSVADLNNRNLYGTKAQTFHKLGKTILSNTNKGDRTVCDAKNQYNILQRFIEDPSLNPRLQSIITDYLMYDLIVPDTNGNSADDLYEYYSDDDLAKKGFEDYKSLMESKKGLNGQHFRSKEEVRIANYFFIHGIKFEYEKTYSDNYKPDFYLPDYDIYLEHFGITKDNRVPFLQEFGNDELTEGEINYLEGIKWKRDIHRRNGTTLLETYSYYFTEGTIFQNLEQMLKKHGVVLKESNISEIYKKVAEVKNPQKENLIRLLQTAIAQYKGSSVIKKGGIEYLREQNLKNPPYRRKRTSRLISIFDEAIKYYDISLTNNKKIDFEDMIIQATDTLCDRETNNEYIEKVIAKYKYILIDEYQDISDGRMELVEAIRQYNFAKLFCVGDDWQSIYQFSGSDLSLFTGFQDKYPYCATVKLSNTYRFSQELSDLSSQFIQKNPHQYEKKILSDKTCLFPVRIHFITDKNYYDTFYSILAKIDKNCDDKAEVLILGRYKNNWKILCEEIGKNTKAVQRKDKTLFFTDFPKLHIQFRTIHTAKGLEADYVIVLGMNEEDHYGFPAYRAGEDLLLQLIHPKNEEYPFEEERRLFYVALTRTKNITFLLADDNSPSRFINEIHYNKEVEVHCPHCHNRLYLHKIPDQLLWTCQRCGYKKSLLFEVDDSRVFTRNSIREEVKNMEKLKGDLSGHSSDSDNNGSSSSGVADRHMDPKGNRDRSSVCSERTRQFERGSSGIV